MFASISVISYNRKKLTEYCINSIVKTTPKGAYELIVVDNGSTDGAVHMLQQKLKRKVIDKLVFNDTTALGAANNKAWSSADEKADWLITFANDHFMMRRWFGNLQKIIEGRDPDYVFCLLRMATFHVKKTIRTSIGGTYVEGITPEREKLRKLEVGGGLAIKKAVVRKHGLKFSEDVFTPKTKSPFSLFCSGLTKLNLKRVDLGKPCALEQDSEFSNPEYESYYAKTFGSRAKISSWHRYKRMGGYSPCPEEYYEGSGYFPKKQKKAESGQSKTTK